MKYDITEDDNYCEQCEELVEEGCIHYSPCCGEPVLFGSDCCSRCREHTGACNV